LPAPQRTARIENEIWNPAQARAQAEGASLGALMRAAVQRYADGQLTSTAEPASQPAAMLTSQPGPACQPASQAAAAITITADGEPCPGVACSGPGCWNRDTARYGLRRLVLCTACAAALQGHVHQRQLPESAARTIRRGAA
jgi:hypothetical protein